MDFSFRRATESDRTYLERIYFLAEAHGDESSELFSDYPTYAAGYIGDWDPERDGGVIVYDALGVPAGAIWLRFWEDTSAVGWANLGPDIPEFAIAIEARAQGKGLSRTLIEQACELARDKGARQLALSVDADNPKARHVYEKFGFRDVADAPHPGTMVIDL
ncbi:GNAT family N-acetyltransferase [Corynebacterium sp. NML98-0116]|uniref:GNAT family N-acetyltransferase n=1 Tax=Corynebacterium pseudogenitalium TaxID=38303 RepID=A0ABD4TRA0_9CORY|nr:MULTISPECIES: GNAT family N-acetyltransferase [Corynebacterium]AOX06140.1 GNAT family N-acetyltransferase [Corynebacterium sp. NML98-0116]MCQ4611590.1 GNAT family N-acetyltransferase [Corynebacterium sp. CCUG 51687]MCQ4614009.1 GNAT family N-acetyltransferase [Corynebacterium pseudogenitalium]OFT31219.1 acetyltransferase [Corynebacterium sp. HMSC08D02]WPJ92355.1 GNAT family N-acetyltransferase [Corynebacterium sp. UMB2355A]